MAIMRGNLNASPRSEAHLSDEDPTDHWKIILSGISKSVSELSAHRVWDGNNNRTNRMCFVRVWRG